MRSTGSREALRTTSDIKMSLSLEYSRELVFCLYNGIALNEITMIDKLDNRRVFTLSV